MPGSTVAHVDVDASRQLGALPRPWTSFGYDELKPYYTRAEWELGVSGEEGALTARTPRSKGYPMPAMGTEPARELLAGAADRLGWTWGSTFSSMRQMTA